MLGFCHIETERSGRRRELGGEKRGKEKNRNKKMG